MPWRHLPKSVTQNREFEFESSEMYETEGLDPKAVTKAPHPPAPRQGPQMITGLVKEEESREKKKQNSSAKVKSLASLLIKGKNFNWELLPSLLLVTSISFLPFLFSI